MSALRNIVVLLICTSAFGASPVGADDEAELRQRGLVQRNFRWLLPLEVQIQEDVRGLPKLEAGLIESQTSAQRLAQGLLAANLRSRLQIQEAEKNMAIWQARRAEIRSSGRRKFVDTLIQSEQEKIAKLRSTSIAPEMIGNQPAMRQAMIQLTNSRNELIATLLSIQDSRPALRVQYAQLARQREVLIALKRLGPEHQLGSGVDYDGEPFLRKLAEYEQHVFTDELPLYRDNSDLRVAAFINRTPVTFTWHTSGEPTMLTASVIEATGLTIPEDAPRMTRRFPDGGELAVRQFRVPYMRFGRHVLKDVPAFALPPEGEQYGTQIGPAAFEGNSPRAEPEKLRLVIR